MCVSVCFKAFSSLNGSDLALWAYLSETTLPKGEINARDIHRNINHKQLLNTLINAPSCAIKNKEKSYVWGDSGPHCQFFSTWLDYIHSLQTCWNLSQREKKQKQKTDSTSPAPGQPCIPNFFPSLWSQTSRNALSGSASSLVRSWAHSVRGCAHRSLHFPCPHPGHQGPSHSSPSGPFSGLVIPLISNIPVVDGPLPPQPRTKRFILSAIPRSPPTSLARFSQSSLAGCSSSQPLNIWTSWLGVQASLFTLTL